MENYLIYLMLFISGIVGGAFNAVAGGGGFIAFPTLIFAGVDQIKANMISTIALWPGNITSAKAYEKDIRISKRSIYYLLAVSGLGALAGAYLLVKISSHVFSFLVPYFLLVSWLMFIFSPSISKYFKSKIAEDSRFEYSHKHFLPLFVVSIYGGYFGAGLGMMILTIFTISGMRSLNEMNGLKSLMVAVNNGVAAIAFICTGLIHWPFTIVMLLGGLLGGYYGASLTRKMNQEKIRMIIITIGGLITLYFFIN